MYDKRKSEVYPILNGRALVKVTLKKSEKKPSWFENLIRSVRYYLIKRKLRSMFPDMNTQSIPIVTLNGMEDSESESPDNYMELNLVSDNLPIFNKVKLAMGGVVTAGLVALTAWGLANRGGTGFGLHDNSQVGLNSGAVARSGEERDRTPVILAESGSEEIILASLVQPADKHPFQKIGHTNLPATEHSNNVGDISHTNTDSYSDITPHTNNTHSNLVNPHTNNHTNHNNHANTSDQW
ncbi:MAG: hypothetical protein K8T10_12340 [Candidatus Eremiobacteraeota bacterium]|nr:hypothetical protein [Candidatus Eremiobacteraeota bacterium]